jgi:ABC-type nickel/cobalt efflux system permease component RcnA
MIKLLTVLLWVLIAAAIALGIHFSVRPGIGNFLISALFFLISVGLYDRLARRPLEK